MPGARLRRPRTRCPGDLLAVGDRGRRRALAVFVRHVGLGHFVSQLVEGLHSIGDVGSGAGRPANILPTDFALQGPAGAANGAPSAPRVQLSGRER